MSELKSPEGFYLLKERAIARSEELVQEALDPHRYAVYYILIIIPYRIIYCLPYIIMYWLPLQPKVGLFPFCVKMDWSPSDAQKYSELHRCTAPLKCA